MNILLVHNYYRSILKGGEDAVFDREVTNLKSQLGDNHIFTYTVHNDQLKSWNLPFLIWSNQQHARAVRTLCKQHDIHIVHIHNFFPQLTASVFKAARKAGAKVVHTLHNYRWWCLSGTLFYNQKTCEACVTKKFPIRGLFRKCYRNSYVQSMLAGLAFWFYRVRALHAVDAFWVLSPHQLNQVKKYWPDKNIQLKPNAIHIPQNKAVDKKGFVFVGRLEPGKGIEALLQTWATLDTTYELTVIGGGDERLVKQYTQPNIHFLGVQPFDVVAQKLDAAKYCLHTSLYFETFGLVMLEAMARGTPVIGFPIGTRMDIIQHEKNGYLVHPEALRDFLIQLQEDNYTKLSQGARETAEHYREDRITAHQIALYQELIDAA